MRMPYQVQLAQPQWARKRREVVDASGGRCNKCLADNVELHVHHKTYKSWLMAWEYDNTDLECLCAKCHKQEHATQNLIKLAINHPTIEREEIFGFLADPGERLSDTYAICGALKSLGIMPSMQIIDFILDHKLTMLDLFSALGRESFEKMSNISTTIIVSRLEEVYGKD